MENIKRKIRLFFVTYGRLLFYIIGAIALVILIIQGLNSLVAEQNSKKMSNTNSEEIINIQKQQQETKADKEYISKFINYCNTGKIEEAYDMISNSCKQEKFSSINEFKVRYIDVIFSIKIYEYKISQSGDEYIIELTEDFLEAGKKNSIKKTKYKVIEDILTRKIYIFE